MKRKYGSRLKATGATGIVLALTSGVSQAVVTEVPVDLVVENFGTPSAVSFNPVGTNFSPEYDDTNFDAIARNCGLSLLASGGMAWTDSAVSLNDTVDGALAFGDPGFPSVPADGESVYYGYSYLDGADTFYGFAMFTGLATGNPGSRDFIFNGYAFEDSSDTGINVGAVPEPSSAATIMALAAGLFALQRRRRISQ